ncbi:MAG: glycyl-radical enzyme activating protein [Synergistales bacterium]|nr:glycyl-radical enzyme activating protein [Synergistales bacterium]
MRTVVFLKGCPLRCMWCATPESQSSKPEIGYSREKCTLCGECLQACPEGVLSFGEDGIVIDRTACTGCFACVESCPEGALEAYGKRMAVSELMHEVEKDEVFYFHSGGGVTISGGEPLVQPAFARQILKGCRERGIHTALESCFYNSWEDVEKVLPYLDLLYVDFKHPRSEEHRRLTGVGNGRIKENIEKADRQAADFDFVIRMPLIPGLNDSRADLEETSAFIGTLRHLDGFELLTYHRLGVGTYPKLGRTYALKDLRAPGEEYMKEKAGVVAAENPGLRVTVNGVSID